MTVNYRDTLNLPDTDFSMKAGLPRKEPEILDKWSSSDLYGKIRKKFLTGLNQNCSKIIKLLVR